MLRSSNILFLLCAATLFAAGPVFAEDPSLHQVYEAAQAGRLAEAEGMMNQVLHDHPNSAKAHFVDAEILAKEGRLPAAKAELATAERLDPALTFAKPESVNGLRALLSGSTGIRLSSPQPVAAPSVAHAGLPWGAIIGGVVVLAIVMMILRAVTNRAMSSSGNGVVSRMGYGPNPTMTGYGPAPMSPMGPSAGGGLGSGILGGLATGAALGAGMVAGEELMHHFTDHGRSSSDFAPPVNDPMPAADDMGGRDFGVNDAGSWDDGSSSSWDDNSSGGGGDWG